MLGKQQLYDEILCSFDPDSLERVLYFRLNKSFDRICTKGTFSHNVYEIIAISEKEGWLHDFIDSLSLERPNNRFFGEFHPETINGNDESDERFDSGVSKANLATKMSIIGAWIAIASLIVIVLPLYLTVVEFKQNQKAPSMSYGITTISLETSATVSDATIINGTSFYAPTSEATISKAVVFPNCGVRAWDSKGLVQILHNGVEEEIYEGAPLVNNDMLKQMTCFGYRGIIHVTWDDSIDVTHPFVKEKPFLSEEE